MTIYRNTIKKITQPINVLNGLRYDIIESSLKNVGARVYENTINKNIDDNFDFDRVFKNVDIIEDMLISVMEKPHVDNTLKIRVHSFVPIKTYNSTLTLLNKYEEKLQRW